MDRLPRRQGSGESRDAEKSEWVDERKALGVHVQRICSMIGPKVGEDEQRRDEEENTHNGIARSRFSFS